MKVGASTPFNNFFMYLETLHLILLLQFQRMCLSIFVRPDGSDLNLHYFPETTLSSMIEPCLEEMP